MRNGHTTNKGTRRRSRPVRRERPKGRQFFIDLCLHLVYLRLNSVYPFMPGSQLRVKGISGYWLRGHTFYLWNRQAQERSETHIPFRSQTIKKSVEPVL